MTGVDPRWPPVHTHALAFQASERYGTEFAMLSGQSALPSTICRHFQKSKHLLRSEVN